MASAASPAYQSLSASNKALLENEAILKGTLLRLRESTSINDFVPCLLVCKKWYTLAITILRVVVVLKRHSLVRFLNTHRLLQSPRPCAIQSLTLLLKVGEVDSHTTSSWALDRLLKNVSSVIAKDMQTLRIFSLWIEGQTPGVAEAQQKQNSDDIDVDAIAVEPGFPAVALTLLLKSLPTTCRGLEIDTSGLEVYAGSDHLCPQLSKLLPQLTHLRLRVRQLCPGFIDLPVRSSCQKCPGGLQPPLCPNLRSLVINMELSSVAQGRTRRCSPYTSMAGEDACTDDLHTELSHHLLVGLTSKNCFPVSERIEIHSPITLDVSPWHHMRRTDIKKRITEVSSFIPLPGYIQGAWRRGTHRCSRSGTEIMIFPWDSHSREHTENVWTSTSEGASLPAGACSQTLSVFDNNDYRLVWQQQEEKSRYQHCLPSYIIEMTRRWKSDQGGAALQPQHPLHDELGALSESDLLTQTYKTLGAIPYKEFPFPQVVPLEWYRKQKPLGHPDFGRVGEGCCADR
ncbi:hypothetical protein AJ79_03967 [Helicocarpus griseus UAMH5409]|uniref:F-box domain-containing protein n=1 Tax=Helicocarpus griseus UAMH5409 TaxID=1447875 RepID=A0A2B7XMJ2_9EURO|nr:hypothetical protein AJ79_03967 [Helicocarpus griseus UAMH5409]